MLSPGMDDEYFYIIDLRKAEDEQVLDEIRVTNPFREENIYDKIGFFDERYLVVAGNTQCRFLDVRMHL